MNKNFRSYMVTRRVLGSSHKEHDTFAGFWERVGLRLAGGIEGRANSAQRKGEIGNSSYC